MSASDSVFYFWGSWGVQGEVFSSAATDSTHVSWLDFYNDNEPPSWGPRSHVELHPSEKSCHGRIKGKLKVDACKLKRQKGYGRIITLNGKRMNIR